MALISEKEKRRRHEIVLSTLGTNAMEGIEPDAKTRVILAQYASGELTLREFSSAMDAHAMELVEAHRALAVVA
jgi:hypothetical protein